MNEEERIQFLKKMGYGGRSLLNAAVGKDDQLPKPKDKDSNNSRYIDKTDLKWACKIFSVGVTTAPPASVPPDSFFLETDKDG